MENKPRLLIYAASWNEKRNLLFSRHLTEYFEVMILTSSRGDNNFFDLIKPVKVFHIKYRFENKIGLAYSNKFRYYIHEYNPDFVLTAESHSISSYQSIKLSKKFKYKPVVFSWQNTSSIPRFVIQKFIQKKVLSRTNYLLAGTSLTKDYLLKKGAEKEKIFVNPESGYDETIFAIKGEDLRKDWGMEPDDVIVLYAGRFTKEKGINNILNAAKKIETANPKIKFVFVGKGELENKIKIFDSQNLYFRGFYDFTDMGKVFRSCNIFVYPGLSAKNRNKQFNYSVIEAQACGKPVIISNSGNLHGFINDGINGSIIKEGDEQSLTEKILLWCDKLQIDREIDEVSDSRFSGRNIALNYKKILLDKDHSFLKGWF
ncbi:MAG: glycosyltransferase family 4 protein [Ignavibacteriaceae bacterium]